MNLLMQLRSIMKHQFIFYFLSLIVIAGAFCSCHFGDAEKMRPTFDDKKRNFTYNLEPAFALSGESGQTIADHGVDGLEINWGDLEQLAVFGKSLTVTSDTLWGADALPNAVKLEYNRYRDGLPLMQGSNASLSFSFEHSAVQGEGEAYASVYPVVYPYAMALDAEGNVLKASVDSIPYDFSEQNGLLDYLRNKHFLAMGFGQGTSTNAKVTITGADNQPLVLTPKMAIVRFSLVVPAEEDYTLHQYILSRSFSEETRYIRRITIENADVSAPGFNKGELNMETGRLMASNNAQSRLVLSSYNGFDTLTDILASQAQSLECLGAVGDTWGTSLYVVIPCTDNGTLHFDGRIQVDIHVRSGKLVETLYGRLTPVTLEEGKYYVTSAIELALDLEDAATASICSTH